MYVLEYTPYAFTSVYMKRSGGACVQAWLNSAVSTVARTRIQLIPGVPDIYLHTCIHTYYVHGTNTSVALLSRD